jgi:hypothetical protein
VGKAKVLVTASVSLVSSQALKKKTIDTGFSINQRSLELSNQLKTKVFFSGAADQTNFFFHQEKLVLK